MTIELAVIVPTRGRPENIRRLIAAWDFTNAWDVADMILAVDADDPEYQGYVDLFHEHEHPDTGDPRFFTVVYHEWLPMVHKLNRTAVGAAESRRYFALGFAGDDHVPETIGWAQRYLAALHEMKTGMVYGDDGYQGVKLSTEWTITADVVRSLGRMVPAPVEHMYCDNSMMDLFESAGALRHLPEIRIEHRHPIAGKAQTDEQYQHVNHRNQFRKDRAAYENWKQTGMDADVAAVRALRPGLPEYWINPPRPVVERPLMKRSVRPTIVRSGPTRRKADHMPRFPFSYEFKNVRGATPDEIGMTLADFASVVPADREIVELGVFNGRTALILAWGAKQGYGAHVTGIDPWDLEGNVYDPPFTDAESQIWARYWVRTLDYGSRIELIQGFSHEVAAGWTGKPVGLLFVDGDHTKAGARRDIESWAPHLAPDAVIAIDDYGHPDWPGVGQAVDELISEGFLAPIQVFHDRLAVTRLADVIQRTDPIPDIEAITSEGVSPSPVPEFPKLREIEVVNLPDADVDNLFAPATDKPDTEVSIGGYHSMTLPELKALAKQRGIVLGARKDKKSEIIRALRDGK